MMEGFYLLCAHLVGDYILQNDWMARCKVARYPNDPGTDPNINSHEEIAYSVREWIAGHNAWEIGNLACLVHCLLYTAAVWAFSWWWMPFWGLAVCFGLHYPIDRYRLARKWMSISGQEDFATLGMAPWSIAIVDNTFHLVTLAAIAMICQR